MEKMTFSLFAVLHGDTEAISEHETFEAETKEDLALQLALKLISLGQDIRDEATAPW